MKTQNNRLYTKAILTVAAIVLITFLGKDVAWSQTAESSQYIDRPAISLKDGDKNPIVILDGIMIEYEKLHEIDPADIEEISILKDKSATAIYGERGKNGVILITKKKPKPKGGFVDMNKAYILKDGKEITSKEFHRLDHRSVDTIITIVDTLAVVKYGDKAKHGAILVQSKDKPSTSEDE